MVDLLHEPPSDQSPQRMTETRKGSNKPGHLQLHQRGRDHVSGQAAAFDDAEPPHLIQPWRLDGSNSHYRTGLRGGPAIGTRMCKPMKYLKIALNQFNQ
jgi:hypothetical protein